MVKLVLSLLITICVTNCYSLADTTNNSLNNKTLYTDSIFTDFSFLIAGHIYGQPSASVHPSPSITTNIDVLKSQNADFIILLGDNYRHFDSINISNFRSGFLNKIDIPIFNSVGNHDIHNENSFNNNKEYSKEFKVAPYYSFNINSNLFIILNSELHQINNQADGTISEDQLEFFKSTIAKSSNCKNILIFSHKKLDLWETNNYHKDIEPTLDSLTKLKKSIYLFSGDKEKSTSDLTYKKQDEITIIHSHINDSKDDKFLKIKISNSNQISIEVISLYGSKTKAIENYLEPPPIRIKEPVSLYEKFKLKIMNKTFIQGLLSGISCFLLIYFLKKLLKSRAR